MREFLSQFDRQIEVSFNGKNNTKQIFWDLKRGDRERLIFVNRALQEQEKFENLNLNRGKNYSGTALIRTPRGHAKVSVLMSVRKKRVNCP